MSPNGLGHLKQLEDIAGVRYQFSRGNVTQITDLRNIDAFFSYDTLGRLVTVTDELNKQTTYAYDAADNLTQSTDRTLVHTDYSYDNLGRLVMVTYPQSVAFGPLVRYAYGYDAVGNLVTEVSPRGGVTRYEYDGLRRLTQVTDAVGGTTHWQYDPSGNVASTTDSVNRMTSYTYDALDRATEVREFPNFTSRYAYDAAGRVTEFGDARGNATGYEYDIMGNLIRVLDAAGGESTFEYNAAGLVTVSVDALDRETSYQYDAVGRLTSIVNPMLATTSFSYDVAGNLTQVDRPGGRRTSFVYDQLNRLEREQDVYGNFDTYTRDAEGRVIAHTDRVGRTSAVLYDALGRVRREQSFLGYEQVYTRDADGNVTKVEGRDTWQLSWAPAYVTLAEYEYDLVDRMTKATRYVDPLDAAIKSVDEYAYDGVHRITTHQDAAGRVQSCQYDIPVPGAVPWEDAVRTECRLGTRQPWRRTHDGVGNLVSVVDPLGHQTRYEYDDLNQLTKIIDARASETQFAYDAVGNLLSLTDPVGNTTTYLYDALDRVTRETNQLGLSRWYAYDAAGNLGWLTDRNGRVRQFSYDLLDRMTAETWPGPNGPEKVFTYSFDAAARLTGAGDNDSQYTYSYPNERAVTIDVAGTLPDSGKPDMPHVLLNEAYDARGQRTSLETTVDGVRDLTNSYQYDLLGRMTQVQQYGVAGGNAVSEKRVDFNYNALGQFTTIWRFNNLSGSQMVAYSQFGYDAYGNLSLIRHSQPAGAVISEYTYTNDDLDRITSVTGPDGTTNYTYDATSQLLRADYAPLPTNPSPLPDETYSYDSNGNRTNTGYVTGQDNRLQQAVIDGDTYQFQYDNEGNLLTRTRLTDNQITEYSWDRRNRLASVARRSAAGTLLLQVTFTYDPFDRRIAKTVSYPSSLTPQASSQLFVYDGIHIALVFEDPDASGPQPSTLDSRLLFGPIVDMVLAEEQFSAGSPPSALSPPRVYWLLADHLGSIRDIISPDCTGGGHIDYTAFGRVAAVFDYLGNASTLNDVAATRFLFTGREYDAEIDLQYNRARYYDAAIGRWLSQDPIGFAGRDVNLYRYVGNLATSLLDPTGLSGLKIGERIWELKKLLEDVVVKAKKLTPEQRGLILDVGQLALDIGGIIEPTPGCDIVSGLISACRGDVLGTLTSGASVIPYLGDLSKLAKLGKYIDSLEQAIKLAAHSPEFARLIEPLLKYLDEMLAHIPWDKLPAALRKRLEKLAKPIAEIATRMRKEAIQNSTKLNDAEKATGMRLLEKGHRIEPGAHIGEEFVDDLGRSYDVVGTPKASKFWNEDEFKRSIDRHLKDKSNDFTVIDLTEFTPEQVDAVRKHIDKLPQEAQDKIIRVGF
jgi:RHS repeat-associated protein